MLVFYLRVHDTETNVRYEHPIYLKDNGAVCVVK